MVETKNSRILRIIPLLIAVCIFSFPARAADVNDSEITAAIGVSTYVFVPDQSTLIQSGGIAGVHWVYSIEGQFQLSIDPNAGVASLTHVDANATDDSPYRRTLVPNEVFTMTTLVGTVIDDTIIVFMGKAADNSDILIIAILNNDLVYLVGQTFPPAGSADFFIFNLDAVAQRKYGGGSGTADDPYQIATAADLITLGETPEDYDKHFIMTADINLEPNLPGRKVFDKAVIAPDTNPAKWGFQGTPFTGVFDGSAYTVSHLTILGNDYLGLFGLLDSRAEVENLRVVNINIIGLGSYVGGLVGYNRGTIIHCCSSCNVDGNSVGGLAGYNVFGVISMSYSTGTVSGNGPVGGLVGQNGIISRDGRESWGIMGWIVNCYSTCNVTGTSMIGGLVGFNKVGAITQCYSRGRVSGNEKVGGFVGENNARVAYSFWDIETSGLTFSASGTGKTTAEMQNADTFISWGACGQIWTIDEGRDYPRLVWEKMPGEFITGPTYSGGTGTAQDPYLIYSSEELNIIGLSFCDWDKHFKLMADIDLSEFSYDKALIAQGGWYEEGTTFKGVFDGNGHTISHLTIKGESWLGLFGRLESGSEVRDLGVVDVNIVGSDSFVGALAGYCRGNLIRCYSSGNVSGRWSVGGLVGASWEAINQCHSSCIVTGGGWIGGLVGANNDSALNQCYSTGSVTGDYRVGGLVGHNSASLIHCYSTGAVSGSSSSTVGGLIGHDYDYSYSDVIHCFWDIHTSGQTTSAGGTGKTTAEMQMAGTFLDVGWDFVGETANGTEDIWWILEGQDYPRLWWELIPEN